MTTETWILYLTVSMVAVMTPGPAVFFIMTNALSYGWRKSVYAAFGNILGLLTVGAIAMVGLGAVLKNSSLVFELIKYVGAFYLIYLGVKLMRQNRKNEGDVLSSFVLETHLSPIKMFVQAYLIALSNPKAIVFMTALFPQFINVNGPLLPQFSMMIMAFMALSFVFLMIYAFVIAQARGWLLQANRMQRVNQTTGAVFIGLGVIMASGGSSK